MGSSPGRVHQRTYVIQTTQNTSPYIGCPIDKLTYDTVYGKFNTNKGGVVALDGWSILVRLHWCPVVRLWHLEEQALRVSVLECGAGFMPPMLASGMRAPGLGT